MTTTSWTLAITGARPALGAGSRTGPRAWSEFSMEPDEFLDVGERVVVVFRMRAKRASSGVAVERRDAMVFELRDGKTVRLDYYNSRAEALEAVGLASR